MIIWWIFHWFVKWWFITLGSTIAIYFALRTIKGRLLKAVAYVGAALWLGSFAIG